MTLGTVDFTCLCSRRPTNEIDDEGEIVAFNRMCPLHKHLAPAATEINRRWCSGSSEPVTILTKRTGRCAGCRAEVSQKYGYAGVHYPGGDVPRE